MCTTKQSVIHRIEKQNRKTEPRAETVHGENRRPRIRIPPNKRRRQFYRTNKRKTMKKVIEYILIAILALLCIFTAWKAYTLRDKIETVTVTDTIRLSDTITQWQPEYVYLSHFDTIKLPVVDTVNDTIIKIDSVLVQIPINTYTFDTTITDSLYRTSLKAITSGFAVTMDSLYLNTEIMPQKVKKAPWYTNIVPAVGLGVGTGGVGIFAGVGLKIF